MLERKDMDVIKHDIAIQRYTYTQIKVKERHFDSCSTFQSHSRVFNIEHTL
jgi:hypothetical protein